MGSNEALGIPRLDGVLYIEGMKTNMVSISKFVMTRTMFNLLKEHVVC